MTMTKLELTQNYHEIRSCKNKVTYRNRSVAKKRAKEMTQTKRNGRIRAYKCEFCPLYHIGHNKYANAIQLVEPQRIEL